LKRIGSPGNVAKRGKLEVALGTDEREAASFENRNLKKKGQRKSRKSGRDGLGERGKGDIENE